MSRLRKQHVPSGAFFCSGLQPVLLQAFLSTCIGVAAFDPVNRVGGLAHFLLSRPVSICLPGDEGKYASTGLPAFFEALVEKGAVLSNLVITVAGGGFSGNLSHQDIYLDIGRRTAEKVKNILSEMKLSVDRWETGGFFTCCLELDLETGKADIVPSYAMVSEKDEVPEVVPPEKIDKAIDRVKPIPQVALKIMRMVGEDRYSGTEMANEVKKDQVISATVLKYCNSVIFSGKKGIDSIDDALMIIGQNALARHVTAIAVKNLYATDNKGYSLVKGGLFHHAIGVAMLAELLAAKTGVAKRFTAYTSGLLHDIGKTVLDQLVSETSPLFYRNCQNRGMSIIELENRYMGTDHTRVGKILAERWNLSEGIKEAVAYHHNPEDCNGEARTADIVALSNILFHMFHAGPYVTFVDHDRLAVLMKKLGLSSDDFPGLVDMVPVKIITSIPEAILAK